MFYSLNFDCVPTGNLLPARSCTAPDSPPPLRRDRFSSAPRSVRRRRTRPPESRVGLFGASPTTTPSDSRHHVVLVPQRTRARSNTTASVRGAAQTYEGAAQRAPPPVRDRCLFSRVSIRPDRTTIMSSAARGVWRSLVARFVRDEEVVGSNPATPTMWRLHDLLMRSSKKGKRPPGRLPRPLTHPQIRVMGLP